MRRIRTDRLLSFDTEWTCWEGDPPEGMSPEIIEIGVVESDPRSGERLREARYLVRPSRSEVSAFCTALTGIAPEELRRHGHPLAEVVRRISKDFGHASKSCLAWGDDWTGVEAECRAAGVENPFSREGFVNVALVYTLATGADRRQSLREAMETLGVNPSGEAHRALDDARDALSVFEALSEIVRNAANRTPPGP